jgi:hypothetical protein
MRPDFNDAARSYLERGLTALNVVVDRATRNGADPDWAPEAEIGLGGLSVASLGGCADGTARDRSHEGTHLCALRGVGNALWRP